MTTLHFHLSFYRLIHILLIIDTHEYTTFIYEKNNILIRNKIIIIKKQIGGKKNEL
jgi:hypothetical protein